MINILMVGNDASVKGGITTVINQLKSYKWNNCGINLKFIPTYINKSQLLKIIFFLKSYIKIFLCLMTKKYKIMHIHMSYKGSFTRAYYIQRLCKLFKTRIIIHLHGSEFKKWYDTCSIKKQMKIKKFIEDSDCFIVLGKKWESIIRKIAPNANITIINNTIKIPSETSKYSNIKKFIFLGVLIKRKGVSDLLKAISLITPKKLLEESNFQIVGSGEEKDNLIKQAKELKIDSHISFLDWVDDMQKKTLLQNSQIMIMPSYNEGLPMSILEAISYGLPVIATNVGDIEEAVIANKNGVIINPGDTKELAKAIKNYIKIPKDEWETQSKYSKDLAIRKFSENKMFLKLEKIYKNL